MTNISYKQTQKTNVSPSPRKQTDSQRRTNGKTSRNHQNDPRMQIEILLPWLGKENQTKGIAMRRLHQIQKNQQHPNPTENDQQYRTRIGTGRHTRNRHTAKPTKFCRIPDYCHNDRCVLALPIRIPNAERHSEDNWTMHCRCHDKTRIFANVNLNG